MLTASVVREFITRTHYRILNDASADADATLRGTVLSTTASPLTYDTATGHAASVLVVVSMKVDAHRPEWQSAVSESGVPVSRAIRSIAGPDQLF